MVSFRTIFGTTIAALVLPAVLAQITPAQIVDTLNSLATKSQALQPTAQSVTIVNGPFLLVGEGPFPVIIRGLQDIVSVGHEATQQIAKMPPVSAGGQSAAIFDAFKEFVRVHQQLMSILTGKAGLFNTAPFIGGPVTAILRVDQGFIDNFTYELVDTVKSRASDIQASGDSLSMAVGTAIQAYEGAQVTKRDVTSAPISRIKRAMVQAVA